MKKSHKNFLISSVVILVLLLLCGGFYIFVSKEKMDLVLYVQDREVAMVRDCGVTKKVIYKIPKTITVADASLKILFGDELAKYGVYKSVSLASGVAKVMFESNMTAQGLPISSLSSCESSHLMSVLNDTLTQYESVKSVKLYSPEGLIQF